MAAMSGEVITFVTLGPPFCGFRAIEKGALSKTP
jgi:hypothetical protein